MWSRTRRNISRSLRCKNSVKYRDCRDQLDDSPTNIPTKRTLAALRQKERLLYNNLIERSHALFAASRMKEAAESEAYGLAQVESVASFYM